MSSRAATLQAGLLAAPALAALVAGGFTAASLGAVWLTLAAALAAALWREIPAGLPVPGGLLPAVLAGYAAWLAVVAYASPVANVAVHGALLAGSLPAAFLLSAWVAGDATWARFQRVALATGLVLALWGLVQKYGLGRMPVSVFVQPNSHAAFLNLITLPLAAAYLGTEAHAHEKRRLAVLAVMCFAVASGLGRGALLGFLGALAFLLLAARGHTRERARRRLALVLLGVFALAWSLDHWAMPERIAGIALATFVQLGAEEPLGEARIDTAGIGSIRERFLIWSASLRMLADTPWYGGFGGFHMRYPGYRHAEDTSSGQYAHNDYLQYLIELGVPGLVLLAGWLLVVAFAWFRRGVRLGGAARLQAAGLAAAVAALAVHSFFSFNFYILPLLIGTGLVLGRLWRLLGPPQAMRRVPVVRWLRPQVARAVIVLCAAIAVAALTPMIAMSYSFHAARTAMLAGDLAAADAALLRAARLFDTEVLQVTRAALCTDAAASLPAEDPRRVELAACARAALTRARALNPYYVETDYRTGRMYETFRERAATHWAQAAFDAYAAVLGREPRHFQARLAAARLLRAHGRAAEALALLETGARLRLPDDPAVLAYGRELAALRRALGREDAARVLEAQLERLERHWLDETAG